jgi:F-type H+-transporting ATPase subunit gamma
LPSTREIRRRIKSVKNIAQVTKAMEAVSAAKMRKAQQQVTATRPYARQAREVLTYIARLSSTDHELNPLIQPRPVKRVELLLVTGDRGLAGGFNANVIRRAALFMREQRKLGAEVTVVTVGRKGRDWLLRYDPSRARRIHRHSRQPDDLSYRADRARVDRRFSVRSCRSKCT